MPSKQQGYTNGTFKCLLIANNITLLSKEVGLLLLFLLFLLLLFLLVVLLLLSFLLLLFHTRATSIILNLSILLLIPLFILLLCNFFSQVTPSITGDDVAKCKKFAKQKGDVFAMLSKSLAPSIHGHEYIKQALLCQVSLAPTCTPTSLIAPPNAPSTAAGRCREEPGQRHQTEGRH